MTRAHGGATCPHLTTPLYCVCREQGHDPALGCLVPIQLSAQPASVEGDGLFERCQLVELRVSPDPAVEAFRTSA